MHGVRLVRVVSTTSAGEGAMDDEDSTTMLFNVQVIHLQQTTFPLSVTPSQAPPHVPRQAAADADGQAREQAEAAGGEGR